MLMDTKMAWRNIWRNPRRTILTVLAIVFACVLLVFMLSFELGSYDTMINSSIKINTGHLQVQAQGYHKSQKMRLVIPDPDMIKSALDRTPQVVAYTSRARAFALVSSAKRTYGAMVVGVDPAKEARVSTLRDIMRQGHYLTDKSENGNLPGALVGRLLARNLNVDLGDEITVLGQGRDGSVAATVLTVQGIYASGMDEFDRNAIHIPLPVFQEVFAMGSAVHEIVVLGADLESVAPIKAALTPLLDDISADTALVALDWDELLPGLRQAIKMDLVSGLISYLILIMVVAFSILNTFLMAILERTREFGVMMAMGARPGRLTRLVLTESTLMTLVGVMAGIVLGYLLTGYFSMHGIDLANFGGSSEILKQYGIPSILYPQLTFVSVASGPAAVCAITLLAALYPALKIRRLKPVDAMGHV